MGVKIFLLVIAAFFSCDGSKTTINKQLKENDVHLVNELIGQWYLCSEVIKGVKSQYNICPKIEFKKYGKGEITKPSKEEIGFIYQLSSESEQIVFSIDSDQQYFDKKEYFYKIHSEDKLEILEISSKDGTSKYTLSREK